MHTYRLLWIVILLCPCTSSGQVVINGGSLVITSSAKDGLIMVADRRSVETRGKDSTFLETTKIYPLNRYYAFSIAGKLSVSTNGLCPARFQTAKVIRNFFESYPAPIISQELLEELATYLFENYRPVLENLHTLQWSIGSPESGDTKLVDIAVCGYDVRTKTYQFGIVSVGYEDQYSLTNGFVSTLRFSCASYSDTYRAFRASTQISIAGKTDLAAKLIRNQNEMMQKFIGNKDKINFNSYEVIHFSKWLIEETSKIDKTVGEAVDIAIIDEKGFRWMTDSK